MKSGRKTALRLCAAALVLVLAGLGARALLRGSAPAAQRQIPILMYHHLTEDAAPNASTVTAAAFDGQMRALYENGWEPVSFAALRDFAENGTALPEKAVVLTFDDGYESNYLLAFPILEKYGFCATVFPIGVSVGKDTYKDTGEAMLPHFSLAQGDEMERSGLIRLESHGYDLHEVAGRDPEPIRSGALPRPEETEAEYAAFIHGDCEKMRALLGRSPGVFAYPYGRYSDLTEAVLRSEGFYATVTTEEKLNTVTAGEPESLYLMGRFNVTDDMTGEALLALIGG